ncbi:MAG: cell division protein ZapA [Clostridia bacterium]|nr:cell division protein ZapA [Clostridia bacterium]
MANKVNLTIAGATYCLTSEESVAYMNELGAEVDSQMRELMKNPRVSTTMAAVLCALNCMDTAKKAEAVADNLRAQMKSYLDDNARARIEADNARREVERLRRELEMLRRS